MNIPNILIQDRIEDLNNWAPNSYFMTKKAISFIENIDKLKEIAVIGYGAEHQSIMLFEDTTAHIYVIDYRKEYIELLKKEFTTQKLINYISPILLENNNPPFSMGHLDLVWTESMTREISFHQFLSNWGQFVKEDGYIVTCAYCWNNSNPPSEVANFFDKHSINIDHYSNRISQMLECGFTPISHFIMPEECWWNFFCPIDINTESISNKYKANTEVIQFLKDMDQEIDMFEKYGDYYGYAFFIGKKYRW